MALRIKIRNPQLLVETIKKNIDSGDITTWSYDEEGDFTCTTDRWKEKAWFTPYYNDSEDELYFGILGRKGVDMTIEEFSVFHGDFVKMLLRHFFYDVDNIEILTPNNNSYDTKRIEY